MANPTGPVSMSVTITEQIDATRTVSFVSEFVVTDEDEAHDKGAQFFGLEFAWLAGYSSEANT